MINVPDEHERDPRLDAAWRAHSTEMPPAKLDAAILAAAHRAVGSKPTANPPQDARESARGAGTPIRAATGPQRWWMPLAAAATIGAVALGILQTAPPDHSVVLPSSELRGAPSPVPPRAISGVDSEVAPPAAPPPALDEKRALQRKDAAAPVGTAKEQVPPANAPVEAAAAVPEASMGKTVAPRAEEQAAPAPAFAKDAAPRAQSPGAAPEPFPAQKKNEATDAVTSQPARPLSTPAPAVQAPAAQPPVAQAPVAQPPAPMAAPARMATANDEARQRNDVAQSAAASGNVAVAKTRSSAEADAAKAIDIDAAIVRIRKLHDDGKLADAAKELIALRAVVPDADHRLPPELRAWAATVKP